MANIPEHRKYRDSKTHGVDRKRERLAEQRALEKADREEEPEFPPQGEWQEEGDEE